MVLYSVKILSKIVYLLNNVKEVQSYLSEKELVDNELLQLCNALVLPKQLLADINRCIDSSGNVLDGASSELRRIRLKFYQLDR